MTFLKNCGIMVEPQEGMDANELVDIARNAEQEGFGYFFRSDHILPTSRRGGLNSPECWVSLGAIAARTKKIKFGSMVSPIGFRNPAILARMASTVNSISSGRLQLGVGAGWYEDEYLAHGLEFPSIKVRKEQFREALQIIRPLTQTGKVKFDGKYFSAHLDKLPKTDRPVHMIIGGKAPSIVRDVLRYADEWNTTIPPPAKFDEMKKMLKASKRNIEISQMGPFIIAEDRKELRSQLRGMMKMFGKSKDDDVFARDLRSRGWLVGTATEFVDEVNRTTGRGVEKIYFQMWQTKDRKLIELLARTLKGL